MRHSVSPQQYSLVRATILPLCRTRDASADAAYDDHVKAVIEPASIEATTEVAT